MTTMTTAAGERIAGPESTLDVSALMDVEQVSGLCRCSPRHVYRMADAGRMPRPLKLGSLVRWNRAAVLAWIAAGCEPVRTPKGGPTR